MLVISFLVGFHQPAHHGRRLAHEKQENAWRTISRVGVGGVAPEQLGELAPGPGAA
jgi:hypothetical protein